MNKKDLRKNIRNKREALSEDYIRVYSERVTEMFFKSDEYKNSNVVMSYMSIKNEVDTAGINTKILEDGKTLLIPRINEADEVEAVELLRGSELEDSGKYGIPEVSKGNSFPKSKIDLIVVPGVAFDESGNRIGFGKGYYDRFLNDSTAKRVALAYPFQVVDSIESEEHDEKVDKIFVVR